MLAQRQVSVELTKNGKETKREISFRFATSISRMLPLFMVLSWIFTVSMNVKDIVQEKEK